MYLAAPTHYGRTPQTGCEEQQHKPVNMYVCVYVVQVSRRARRRRRSDSCARNKHGAPPVRGAQRCLLSGSLPCASGASVTP